jgi:V/A-type H+/Na+-transporting ATPase subunit I
MRQDVKKFLFVGSEEDKNSFFKRAQRQGIIHFIDPLARPLKEPPEDLSRVMAAIKVLRGLPPTEQEENFSDLQANEIVSSILSLHEQNERLLEELRVLEIEMARIEVFGNFSFDDIAYIEKEGHCKIRFFCARPALFEFEPEPDSLIYIASEHGLNYYIAIDQPHPIYEKMIEMKFERSLGDLKRRFEQVKKEHHRIEQALKDYAKYHHYLHHVLIEKLNFYHLHHAQTSVQKVMEGSLFAVEGWVPVNQAHHLEEIVGDLKVHTEEIAVEPTDAVPTCLENQGVARLGEDLVNIYDTPSATDKDPSMWVLGAFTFFFSFIIGDAGYGLVYLAIALFLYYKYPNLKGTAKRILNLFTLLCVGCIVWGTLMTSFFGMHIDLNNPLRRLSLLQWLAEKRAAYHIRHQDEIIQSWREKYPELPEIHHVHQVINFVPVAESEKGYVLFHALTDKVLFELALFIGVVHLILSLLRYAGRNWSSIGWVLFLVGAYLYFPFYLETPSLLNYVGGIDLAKGGAVGFQLMFAGIGAAWILSIIRYGWTGIFEIMNLIQVVADSLSYLRLYALCLAGAIVASTINEIAYALPFFLGMILILISHFANIVLNTMGGVIHGLRLNFLEWYHYSFEGGGKPFQPLKLLKKD